MVNLKVIFYDKIYETGIFNVYLIDALNIFVF